MAYAILRQRSSLTKTHKDQTTQVVQLVPNLFGSTQISDMPDRCARYPLLELHGLNS